MIRSRYVAVLIAGFLVLGPAVSASAQPSAAKGPRMAFKEDSWNFGKSKQGQDLVHDFVFTNTGDAVLNVKGVETSCGCTAALVTDKKVEPGKSGRIKVTFATRGYAGEVTKFIYIESDDPITPRIQLKITAAIDVPPAPRIDLDRYSWDAGLLLEGEAIEAEVTVRNRGELELTFDVAQPQAAVSVNGRPASFPIKLAPGKEAEVAIKLPLTGRFGLIREYPLFRSNDPQRSTISINISGYIVTKVQLKQLFEKYKAVIK